MTPSQGARPHQAHHAAVRLLRGPSARARIPFIAQLTETECGVACLAMALAYFGRPTPREEIRDTLGVGRGGTTAHAIAIAARHYGLRARGVRVDVASLGHLAPASILHWGFNHFVVFERVRARGIDVVDPSFGRTFVPFDEVSRAFTGVALTLSRGVNFQSADGVPPSAHGLFARLLRGAGAWGRIIVLSTFLQLLAFAVPLFTGSIVDRIVPRADAHLLGIVAVVLALVLGFQLVASLVRAHLLLAVRTVFDADLTLGLLERMVDLPYAFFQKRSAGDLMMRLNSNVMIREILTSAVLSGALDGLMMLVSLVAIVLLNGTLGLLVCALAAVQVAAFAATRGQLRELSAIQLARQARCQGYQVEMLTGMETLKALGCERRAEAHYADLFVDAQNAQLALGSKSAWLDALSATIRTGAPLIVLATGALQVMRGSETLGNMLAESSFALGIFGPLAALMGVAGQLATLRSYADRVEDIHAATPEQPSNVARVKLRLRGAIDLERVSFRYAPIDPLVVDDVSLSIRAGELVAIVGRSGSGKTSLANLLAGLHPPSSGRVLYDGVSVTDLDLRDLRAQMGIVTQRTHLFAASIRANIALGDPTLPLSAIARAAKQAAIDEDIDAMPMGYETLLLDGGGSLSGGQRQRLALARALVREPAILLLDEATSALDTITERLVEQSLATSGSTRIVIAHRMSTVMRADRIVVMQDGRIVEQGTHEALVARDGAYASLIATHDADADPRSAING
jgi:ATP-binding cassette subfamily B protein